MVGPLTMKLGALMYKKHTMTTKRLRRWLKATNVTFYGHYAPKYPLSIAHYACECSKKRKVNSSNLKMVNIGMI